MSNLSPVGYVIRVGVGLPDAPPAFLGHLPYLGGVLHGALSQYLSEQPAAHHPCAPAAPWWRLLAPPWQGREVPRSAARWLSATGMLHFGVIVHRGASDACQPIVAALRRIEWLGAGTDRYPVRELLCKVDPLPQPPVPTGSITSLAPSNVRLNWVTPLVMASKAQIAAGHGRRGPSLLRIVRSLASHACELQPAWAASLGIGTPSWTAAEERLRGGNGTQPELMPADWRYGSRTKARPHDVVGVCGEQSFVAPLSEVTRAVLDWGHWLGVGQRASYGCGQYEIAIED